MNRDRIEKLFVSIAEQYEEHDDIKDRVRGLHSYGEISDEEYDYIIQEWDNMLVKHGL